MTILPESQSLDKSFPPNLCDTTSPFWMEFDQIFSYVRTSSSQTGEPGNGKYQSHAIGEAATKMGYEIVGSYSDIGKDGYSIGTKTTPELWRAIQQAEKTGTPIVAFDWTRFCRNVWKLNRFPHVMFVSVVPLTIASQDLPGIRKRAANKFNPRSKGGRPRNKSSNAALPDILTAFCSGQTWVRIAKSLGSDWSDKKVSRLFARELFDFKPLK